MSRRTFLAGGAALLAAPAVRAAPAAEDVDVVIVGAGAAGIAAAKRLVEAKRRVAVFEAGARIGGRCITDPIFGAAFDLGAHWIYDPDGSPLLAQAPKDGLDVYPAPRGQSLRVGPRRARDVEMEDFLAALVRAHRAIAEAGRGRGDVPADRALPKDLGDWQSAIDFVLGPYTTGKSLTRISAVDLARAAERDSAAFCREGYGALLARLGAGLPVRLADPVKRIAWDPVLEIETVKGKLRARAAIVTASTNVLAAGKIAFAPALPKTMLDAATHLSLGSLDHIALDIPGNPLGLQRDDLVFERASGPRTAALLANVSGTSLHVVTVGGAFGRDLAAEGEAAMADFAGTWLSSIFGTDMRKAIRHVRATRWNDAPWIMGAMSGAAPGAADARRVLAEPVGGRLWFAGEAAHATRWGTVNGAWESGMQAAEAVLRRFGSERPAAEKPARHPRRKRRRER